jgi:hypothetical protein
MGLINLQTDLKSLKYGRDRKGGGDSGQPYIKKDIPSKSDELDNALKYGTGGPDMFLRGGLLTPSHILDDTIRLGKYFIDVKSPRGLLFIAQQNVLSRAAVKTEASYGAAYGGGIAVSQLSTDTNVVGTGPVNEGIYLPTSTLLQAAGLPFGLHLNKQGIDPTELIPGISIKKYYDVVSEQLNIINANAAVKVNRLYKLFDQKIYNESLSPNLYSYGGGPGSILGIGKTNISIVDDRQRTGLNNINGKKIVTTKDPNNGLILTRGNYLVGLSNTLTNRGQGYAPAPGGAIIFNGNNLLGASDAFFAETEINGILIEEPLDNGFDFPDGQQTKPYGPKDNNSTLSINDKNENLKTYQATQKSLVTLDSPDSPAKHIGQSQINQQIITTGASAQYKKFKPQNNINNSLPNLNSVYKLGDNGSYTLEPNFGTGVLVQEQKSVIDSDTRVEQNISEPLDAPQDGGSTKNKFNAKYGTLSIKTEEEKTVVDENSDSTPFYITVISNEGSNLNQVLFFPAYITTFDDGIDAEWGAERFMGRGEEFFTYNGFKRSINIGFQIYPNNEAELIQMYNQLNILASALTPDYSTNGFMRGSLFKLTLGNYVTDLPGIIKSIKFSVIDNEKITWDVDSQVPKYIEIKSFEFTPIHNFLPRKGQNFFGRPLYGDINPFPQPINNP